MTGNALGAGTPRWWPRVLAGRLANASRRLAAGLPLRGENVNPEVETDLFLAHLSIYRFCARYVSRRRVLDLGCGCGYGSFELLQNGAIHVTGVDRCRRSLRYARRRYVDPDLRFRSADIMALPGDLGTFDLIVASNVLEHLTEIEPVLDRLRLHMSSSGTLVVAVPPIVDAASRAVHETIRYHRCNLHVSHWLRLLTERYHMVEAWSHLPPAGRTLDFASPFPATGYDGGGFDFVRVEPDELGRTPTLTAVFVANPR